MPRGQGQTQRYRMWAFIVYPDSAPDGWISILREQGLMGYISPLHTPDEKDKKQHYHVMLRFENQKSESQIDDISKSVNGSKPRAVQVWTAYARYLLHLDDPQKEQFADHSGVVSLGGAKYAEDISRFDVSDEVAKARAIMKVVWDAGIMDFYTALGFIEDSGHHEWVQWLYEHGTAATWLRDTLKSAYHQWERSQRAQEKSS